MAIVGAAEDEAVDVLVVGNLGMAGRKQFLLGNVPNQVSHNARCTVIIVNTGGPADARETIIRPVVAEEEGRALPGPLLRRAARIGRVMAKFGLRELFARTPDAADEAQRGEQERIRARRLRDALDELGPTFAKLGQILSTRPDLLPAAFIDELSTLQDRVTPLTEEEVVSVMEQELRVPWEDVFASIDPEPLAAGTIGQVHRATLDDGSHVVIKVQRPRAEEEILRDLGLFELFAEKALKREQLRRTVDIPALVEHLSESLRRELDFREEAANVERMLEVLAPYDRLDVPRPHSGLLTSR